MYEQAYNAETRETNLILVSRIAAFMDENLIKYSLNVFWSVIKRFIWTKWTGSNLNEKSNPLKGVTLRDFQISDILLSCSIFSFLFLIIDLFNTSMLPCVCSVIDHRSGNDKNVAHEAIAECITEVLTTFWRLLWFVTEQTHAT